MKNDVSRREVKDLVNATFGAEAQVAELAKSPCQGEGREFESRHPLVEKGLIGAPRGTGQAFCFFEPSERRVRISSSSLKVGTTLLDEGFHAFDLICGATAPSYGFSLDA